VAISMKEISQAVSCSPKTVSKAVQKLFFLRIIDKISKPPEVNRYFLLK
jgi:DNA-binding Lrp family transcriptional regulator